MNIDYERACREAGTETETVMEIRRMIDLEKKRKVRDREKRRKAGIVINSLSALAVGEHTGDYEIADSAPSPEEEYIHREDLKRLRECLERLSSEDREIILAVYEEERSADTRLAARFGIKRTTFIDRKKRILRKLQEVFFEGE